MNVQQVKDMVLTVSEEMTKHTHELCALDAKVGDGDHGLTVERGFKAVQEQLNANVYERPADLLKDCGDTLMNTMGGAIGPILGSFFRGGNKKLKDLDEFGTNEFETLLNGGLRQIQLIGEAKEGDRTLVDALAPAVRAYVEAKEGGAELKQCMEKAASAAEEGAENTKNMIAKKGRAKFLEEKSLGYVDAGATTMSIILRAMSNYLNQ